MFMVLKTINLALAFLLELGMLAAFAYWGFKTGESALFRIVLGIGVPLLVAVIWGIFMAPNSARRLKGAAYLALKIILFGLAVGALIAAGSRIPGMVLGALFVLNTILLFLWHQ